MDRPSTIMLCRVVPGIGFKVIRVFSASATNSGSFREQTSNVGLRCRRRFGSTLAFRCRFGEGGKLRLIVKRAREDIQQGLERRVIGTLYCSTQGFLNSMIARNERRIGTPHRLRTRKFLLCLTCLSCLTLAIRADRHEHAPARDLSAAEADGRRRAS